MDKQLAYAPHREKLALAKKLAWLLDAAFVLPGTGVKVGLDPLLGLIPGLGDVVSLAVSLYIVQLAREMGLPNAQLRWMLFNVAMDAIVGSVPLLGDFLDVMWKANLQNTRMMERFLENQGRHGKHLSPAEKSDMPPGEQTINVAAEYPRKRKS